MRSIGQTGIFPRSLARVLIWGLCIGIILGCFAFLFRESISEWLKDRAVQAYVNRVQPHLPFDIKNVELDASVDDVLKGKISKLSFELHQNDWRGEFKGNLAFGREEDQSNIQLTYEGNGVLFSPKQKTKPFQLKLILGSDQKWSKISEIELHVSAKDDWNGFGIDANHPKVRTVFLNEKLRVQIEFKELSYESESETFSLLLSEGKLDLQGGLSLQPLKLHSDARLSSRLGDSEFLIDETYLQMPLQPFDFDLSWKWEEDLLARSNASGWVESAELKWVKSPKSLVTWSGQENTKHLTWNLAPTALDRVVQFIDAAIEESLPLKVTGGTLSSRGQVSLDSADLSGDRHPIRWNSSVSIKNGVLEIPTANFAAKGIDLHLPLHSNKTHTAVLSIDRFHISRLLGKLNSTRLGTSVRRAKKDNSLSLVFFDKDGFHLSLDSIPLSIAGVNGELDPDRFRLESALFLDRTSIYRFMKAFCVDSELIPPADLELILPEIKIDKGHLRTKGQATLRLFRGEIEVSDLKSFDLLTDVPELNFDAKWKGIRLDQIGKWLSFGKMDGMISGHALGVTFQSWLPTQYNFLTRVNPLSRTKIVFSARAMRNLVKLFAGDDLEESLPGFADWLAFGWLSDLFGGYNIDYAGMSLYSSDGAILVETLDPEDVFRKERKRFILYGPRFKIPLKGTRYPVVLDGPGMANLTRRVIKQIRGIKSAGETSSEEELKGERDESEQCNPKQF